jgi:hypothetical protein
MLGYDTDEHDLTAGVGASNGARQSAAVMLCCEKGMVREGRRRARKRKLLCEEWNTAV